MDALSQPADLASPIYIPSSPSPEPRFVPPPPSPNEIIRNVIGSGEPISPRSGLRVLDEHFNDLDPGTIRLLTTAVAQGSLREHERAHNHINALQNTTRAVVAAGEVELKQHELIVRAQEQRINELEVQVADNVNRQAAMDRLQDHISTLEDKLDQADECPEGYVGNCGRAPEFRIPCEGGFSLQARYIKALSHGLIAGTMGGLNDETYVHDLFAQTRISGANPAPVLDRWFIALMAVESRHYDDLVGEAKAMDDWGVTADIERYHAHDTRLCALSQHIRRLQEEQDENRVLRDQAQVRLARAEASSRLYSAEVYSPIHKRGGLNGPRFPGRCGGKRARGRASFEE